MKRTLVLGAHPDPSRYANKAVVSLRRHGHEVYAFGVRSGTIADVHISSEWPSGTFDTVTLYLNPDRQQEFYDRILQLNPKRVIFNPGTENVTFERNLMAAGIQVEEACTLVMLSVGNY